MKIRVQMWGNSLALRIPKPFACEFNLKHNSEVDVSIEDGQILVKPVIQNPYDLGEMLKKINKNNIHEVIYFGPPQGKEIW
jgi:antitoxin MazE